MKHVLFAFVAFTALTFSSCTGSKKTAQSNNPANGETGQRIHYAMLDQQTFALTTITSDESYGYSQNTAIKVGGVKESSGPFNERRFLNALLGPNGETITYMRRGSCCAFKTANGFNNVGLLDIYEVIYEGLDKPITLYINMYDYGELKAPKGFTYRK
ncbi:2-dehydro-3-deoxyphosphooctonate aldolase [Lacibacter sediminis]|uniref:2-dehydro-3-deoxyphosphooctonate aldolase n=1 Tax=Lacibacter sediminis TaxID=2760713 RepID=A0A7G5XBS4_9BACT|nr:2-dehydro-3-deoxyphosphooctonate aldolase [Lacibacter sediminis]QNA42927.1 2-dehydro-3-deoxyphosphooctonate aldolase [Lacibacter sediminis]